MIRSEDEQRVVFLLRLLPSCTARDQSSGAIWGDYHDRKRDTLIRLLFGVFGCLALCNQLGIVLLATPAYADLIAYEGFDYDVGSPLQRSDGGTGFTSDWDKIPFVGGPSLITDYHDIAAGSLSFGGLETAGNHVHSSSHSVCCKGLFRELPGPIGQDDTATVYLSFLMQPETLDGWFGLDLGPGIIEQDVFVGFPRPWTISEPIYQIDNIGGVRVHPSDIPAVVGETAFFVVKAEFASRTDSFTLYMNPTPGLPEPQIGIVKADNEVGDVKYLGFASMGGFRIDEIRVGESFEDVTPVAEVHGDFSGNGILDAADIDLLGAEIRSPTGNAGYDINGDGEVALADHRYWVQDLAATFYGDADLDRHVQFGDFVLLADGFGAKGGWAQGDFDGDEVVQFSDLVLLADNFGKSAGAAAATPSAAAVPEPKGALLLIVGAVSVVFRRSSLSRDSVDTWVASRVDAANSRGV